MFHVSCAWSSWKQENLASEYSSNFNYQVKSLLDSLYLLSKLSCQDVRDVDDVKRVLLLQTGRISQMQCVRLTAEKGGDCEGIHS